MSTANHLPGSVSGSDETRADTDVYGLHFVRALATPQDIVAIERRGHDAFLPWPHVPAALDSAARVFAERPALRYLRSAEPNEAPVTWTHGELARNGAAPPICCIRSALTRRMRWRFCCRRFPRRI